MLVKGKQTSTLTSNRSDNGSSSESEDSISSRSGKNQ